MLPMLFCWRDCRLLDVVAVAAIAALVLGSSRNFPISFEIG